jgi:hypothetical protein
MYEIHNLGIIVIHEHLGVFGKRQIRRLLTSRGANGGGRMGQSRSEFFGILCGSARILMDDDCNYTITSVCIAVDSAV